MRQGLPGRDQATPHRYWKGQVGQVVAMKVPKLALAKPKLNAPVAVLPDRHARPLSDFPLETLADGAGRQPRAGSPQPREPDSRNGQPDATKRQRGPPPGGHSTATLITPDRHGARRALPTGLYWPIMRQFHYPAP